MKHISIGIAVAMVGLLALGGAPGSAAAWSYHALGRCFITGYTPAGDRTASGTWPAVGRTVAVDPQVIPMGARVRVGGLGVFRAEDTGGAIRGCRIDVFVATDADAYALTGYRSVSWWR